MREAREVRQTHAGMSQAAEPGGAGRGLAQGAGWRRAQAGAGRGVAVAEAAYSDAAEDG